MRRAFIIGMIGIALIALVGAATTSAPPPPARSQLVDHRALYKMSLARTTPGSDVQGLSGQMVLEVKSTCDGSAVTQMLKTQSWDDDQTVQNGALTASSFEANDGKSFRFSLHNEIDGQTVDDFQGTAARKEVSADGTIIYAKSTAVPVVLPAGAVFPSQYMERLLDVANAKQHVLSVVVFDGAEQGKIFRSTSIIGPRNEEPSPLPALSGVAHWPVVLSYFRLGSDAPTPDYETSFDLYANGVSAHLIMDYGDFAMKGELTSLEILPFPKCK